MVWLWMACARTTSGALGVPGFMDLPDDLEAYTADDTWEQVPPHRTSLGTIEIRGELVFGFGRVEVAQESAPVLVAVGEVMDRTPEIALLVVEGHADHDEPSPYQLAESRARWVHERLIAQGIHLDRLAYRSAGALRTSDLQGRPHNRAVAFHVARIVGPGEPLPSYRDRPAPPWTVPPPPPARIRPLD
ncbi:MAG: hypothetical protein AAF602_05375 [Myxococcota bacterium]